MSDRFAYLYEHANKFNLRILSDEFSSRGISLANPANGRITALSEDGDQIDITLDGLEAAITTHDPLTFQFWMPGHADVCCRFRYLSDDRLVEQYWLEGLSGEERARILTALTERFKSKAGQEDDLFLVADSEGYTFELDWDSLSLKGKYEFSLCPNILGISLARLGDFENCGQRMISTGQYIIIDALNQS